MSKRKNRKDLGEGDFGEFKITESGNKEYELEYFLQKTFLKITYKNRDNELICVWIDMRVGEEEKGAIRIKRRGDVDWHLEEEK